MFDLVWPSEFVVDNERERERESKQRNHANSLYLYSVTSCGDGRKGENITVNVQQRYGPLKKGQSSMALILFLYRKWGMKHQYGKDWGTKLTCYTRLRRNTEYYYSSSVQEML